MHTLDISGILDAIILAIGRVFTIGQTTIINIGSGLSFSLNDLFIGALVFAILVSILLPRGSSADVEGEDDNV